MKNLLLIVAMAAGLTAWADQYVARAGKAHFFSATAMENIEATSAIAVCALNTANKKIVVKIKNKSFRFKDGLMEEHFNENYMESDKYEYSTLEGVIADNIDFTKDGVYNVTIHGTLDIHGVKQERDIKGTLTIQHGAPVNGKAKFDVKLADYNIKVPSIVGANIAEAMAVDVDFNFEKYEKK
jgi:polyisoprenoid-binding protein YceI